MKKLYIMPSLNPLLTSFSLLREGEQNHQRFVTCVTVLLPKGWYA